MRIELFTVEEANKLAVDIRPRLERLVEKKREFDGLEKRMSILLVATSGAAPENPDTRELRSLEEKRRRLGESIGKGVHELVRKKCDFLISIPMLGKVPSLNVSVAAGVVLYEIVRQRQQKATADSK